MIQHISPTNHSFYTFYIIIYIDDFFASEVGETKTFNKQKEYIYGNSNTPYLNARKQIDFPLTYLGLHGIFIRIEISPNSCNDAAAKLNHTTIHQAIGVPSEHLFCPVPCSSHPYLGL